MTKEHPDDSVGQSETSLWIGIFNGGYSQAWNGIIDEVRLWKKALSNTDIQRVMQQGKEIMMIQPKNKLAVTWGTIKLSN